MKLYPEPEPASQLATYVCSVGAGVNGMAPQNCFMYCISCSLSCYVAGQGDRGGRGRGVKGSIDGLGVDPSHAIIIIIIIILLIYYILLQLR